MKNEMLNIASLDDIIFDGRNKNYGAYELRSNYKNRLLRALLLSLLFPVILFFLSYTSKKIDIKDQPVIVHTTTIEAVKNRIKLPEKTPPKEQSKQVVKIKKAEYSTIKLVNDAKAMDDIKDIKTSVISDTKENGKPIITNTPQLPKTIEIQPSTNTSTTSEVKKAVDVLAQYNGNWAKFLTETLQEMMDGIEVEQNIAVRVEFIVDIDGSVTEIKALNGPTELQRVAERAIKKSGNWIPAEIAGKPVKAYRIQKIIFQSPE